MSLKLVKGNNIRKVTVLPVSFAGLMSKLESLYGHTDFTVCSADEIGEEMIVQSDTDLNRVYEINQGKPSIRIVLKEINEFASVFDKIADIKSSIAMFQTVPVGAVQELPTVAVPLKSEVTRPVLKERLKEDIEFYEILCGECKRSPIYNICYQCTQCIYYLCEDCEATLDHIHPMIKIKKKQHFPVFTQLSKPTYRLKVKSLHLYDVVKLGEEVTFTWKFKNKGAAEIPEDSSLVLSAGNIHELTCPPIPKLRPGDSFTLRATTTPQVAGEHFGTWSLFSNSLELAELKGSFYATPHEKLRVLYKLGFPISVSQDLLRTANDDLLAILANL